MTQELEIKSVCFCFRNKEEQEEEDEIVHRDIYREGKNLEASKKLSEAN